jgi:hypothetical protein
MIVRVVGAGYLFFREADSFNNPINADKKLRCAPFFPGYW